MAPILRLEAVTPLLSRAALILRARGVRGCRAGWHARRRRSDPCARSRDVRPSSSRWSGERPVSRIAPVSGSGRRWPVSRLPSCEYRRRLFQNVHLHLRLPVAFPSARSARSARACGCPRSGWSRCDVVTFSWTSRPGGEPLYGGIQQETTRPRGDAATRTRRNARRSTTTSRMDAASCGRAVCCIRDNGPPRPVSVRSSL